MVACNYALARFLASKLPFMQPGVVLNWKTTMPCSSSMPPTLTRRGEGSTFLAGNVHSTHIRNIWWHGKEASIFYKRLATMLAAKWGDPYSQVLCWRRCRLAFSLLRSSIQAIRGARSSRGHPIRGGLPIDLIRSEAAFN